jgi:hypothetical protein
MSYYIDFPVFNRTGGHWENVGAAATKAEAIAWIKGVLGDHAVDSEGRICLLTVLEDDHADRDEG